jgi:hypothetical protein
MKRANLILLLLCAVAGAEYFTTFSNLAIAPSLKPIVTLAPIQVGVLIYFLVKGKLTPQKKLRDRPKRVE